VTPLRDGPAPTNLPIRVLKRLVYYLHGHNTPTPALLRRSNFMNCEKKYLKGVRCMICIGL
jgi:hypothetical protein